MKRDIRLAVVLLPFALMLCGPASGQDTQAVEANPAQDKPSAEKKLTPIKDPIMQEIAAFQKEVRSKFDSRNFDELEKLAADLRSKKETFSNGSWKIYQFHSAMDCGDKKPKEAWEAHEQILKDWIAAKPDSVTAKIAYGGFLTDYAWQARGSGYANTVTEDGWKLFADRLTAASEVLKEATKSPDKDPMLGRNFQTVALGQGWPKSVYETMMEKLWSEEPAFWSYDVARAYSLLPRWYGEEGEWEAFAEKAAARPKGLGNEVYARIVMNQRGYYDNIFRETKASWPKTREGLEILRKKYPDSLEIVNSTALLAALAQDRKLSKEMFDRLGDSYVTSFWRTAERFSRFREWAETGKFQK